ncbi:DUF2190 family protein [Termitidicoccus mucosus]|uniref:Uncharacterized protein n=1 Tax=Termitidicoccus mucosus TaxID=1184151 RepID=A0A178IJ73_9BACT|nr:hypothetical protein AW736_13885 [Opitutaceae bacterium TSB47]
MNILAASHFYPPAFINAALAVLAVIAFAIVAFAWFAFRFCHRRLVTACNIAEGTHAGRITKFAGAAIGESYLLGKFGADANHVVPAAAADKPIGVITDQAEAAEDPVNVSLLGSSDTTILVRAAGEIAAGSYVVPAAAGRVQALPAAAGTYILVGRALTAAAAAGDLVEIDPIAGIPTVVTAG